MLTIIRSIALSGLKDFLDRTEATSHSDIESVPEEESFECDKIDLAVSRVDLACRAIVHELAILVEHEIQHHAHPAWILANRVLPSDKWFERPKLCSDEKFPKLLDLIKDHYGVDPKVVCGWSDVERLRTLDNDLKHRKGLIHPRESLKRGKLLEWVELSAQDARGLIADVWSFLNSLETAIDARGKSKPSDPPPET